MSEAPATPEAIRRRKMQLILLLGIVLVPIFASYVMYLTGFGLPTGTSNKGILLTQPLDANELRFVDSEGNPWSHNEDSKFRWLHVIDGECDEPCREFLVTTRQVHIRLSERARYVERVLVNTGDELDAEFADYLSQEHTRLQVVSGDYDSVLTLLEQSDQVQPVVDGSQVFIMDRRGYLMMAYQQQHSGGELLDDMKFLLKTTR